MVVQRSPKPLARVRFLQGLPVLAIHPLFMTPRVYFALSIFSLSLLTACQSQSLETSELRFTGNEAEMYSFIASGLEQDELIPPEGVAVSYGENEPVSLAVSAEVPKDGESVVTVLFNGNEPRGTWNLSVEGSEGFYAETSFEYAPQAPAITLISVEPDESTGYTNYVFIGSGWDTGENLTFTTAGPDSPSQEIVIGTASEAGLSVQIPVPFISSPADGIYTFAIIGDENGTADYQLICSNGICQ